MDERRETTTHPILPSSNSASRGSMRALSSEKLLHGPVIFICTRSHARSARQSLSPTPSIGPFDATASPRLCGVRDRRFAYARPRSAHVPSRRGVCLVPGIHIRDHGIFARVSHAHAFVCLLNPSDATVCVDPPFRSERQIERSFGSFAPSSRVSDVSMVPSPSQTRFLSIDVRVRNSFASRSIQKGIDPFDRGPIGPFEPVLVRSRSTFHVRIYRSFGYPFEHPSDPVRRRSHPAASSASRSRAHRTRTHASRGRGMGFLARQFGSKRVGTARISRVEDANGIEPRQRSHNPSRRPAIEPFPIDAQFRCTRAPFLRRGKRGSFFPCRTSSTLCNRTIKRGLEPPSTGWGSICAHRIRHGERNNR